MTEIHFGEAEDDEEHRARRTPPSLLRLLIHTGRSSFETDDLVGSADAFEEALEMQRALMRGEGAAGVALKSVPHLDDDDGNDADAENAHRRLLDVALTLCNLGSIHLRRGMFDDSLVCFEEALLVS